MSERVNQNIKLGLFVFFGVAVLVFLLYFIGAKQNIFGKQFVFQSTFKNISGLRAGNNVRLAGINVGTIKDIQILSDTAVLLQLSVDNDVSKFIKSNDILSIGSDGLMGNRVVNIEPGPPGAPLLPPNGFLKGKEILDMDALMRTLDITNRNFANMSEDLVIMVKRISRSTVIWELLEDPDLPRDIRMTITNIRSASQRANQTVRDLQIAIHEITSSEEGLVALMKDSTLSRDFHAASANIRSASMQADSIVQSLHASVQLISSDLESGKGPLNAMLRDSTITRNIQRSLYNVEKGTRAFNENMQALKDHFLFRNYFRRAERKATEEQLEE